MSDFLLQEDGSSKFVLEDSSGDLLQETAELAPSFIASVTVVYTPTLPEVNAPTITSVTALFTPRVHGPQVGSFVQILGSSIIASTTGTVTLTTDMTAGDSIVVAIKGGAGTGTVSSVTDNRSNTYVQEIHDESVTNVGIWTCKTPGTALISGDVITTHWTDNEAGNASVMTCLEYVHLGTRDATGTHGNAGSVGSGSVTSSGATTILNEVAIVAVATTNALTQTSTSSFVKRTDGPSSQHSIHVFDLDLATTSTPTCSWSNDTGATSNYIGLMATFPVAFTNTKAQTAKARIQITGTKQQTSTARIQKSVTKSQTAKARIQKSTTKTQSSIARISSTLTKQQTSTARIISSTVDLDVPFIPSKTVVWPIFSLFDPNKTYSGPGNGGETFEVQLNLNGVTTTATLAAGIGISGSPSLTMSGDSGMPDAGVEFVVTIDSEQILLISRGASSYMIRQRGMGNTTPVAHSLGVTVSWGDSYDEPITSTIFINSAFTADIESTGSTVYNGWLVAFDSSQAYKSDGSRYPLHVSELVGVFVLGAGTSGTNKLDSSQPSAIHAPESPSDHCGAALTVPALIAIDIVPGDVVVVRYKNPEAYTLDLGPRSGAIQSWYGLKRVDLTDNDVTFTNPNGIVVDTKSGYASYTGSVNTEPNEPLPSVIGIAPDASDAAGTPIPTPNPVPWLNVTLPGTDRYFTDSIHYNERGWPIGVLSCRQGGRRVPLWQSWDWHEFSYVYSGFGTDDSFAQVVINRNGMTGLLPTISLPGPQNIDGPDAVWDDGTYYFGASWYVVLVATPYLVVGPVIGGTSGPTGPVGPTIPTVTFPGGGIPPVISPPVIDGGSGGDIAPTSTGLHTWQIF